MELLTLLETLLLSLLSVIAAGVLGLWRSSSWSATNTGWTVPSRRAVGGNCSRSFSARSCRACLPYWCCGSR